MIGQGVVNFGWLLGPFAAALLMSFWVAVLARLDLQIQELGRLPLCLRINGHGYSIRHNVASSLYPFVFGYLMILGVQTLGRGIVGHGANAIHKISDSVYSCRRVAECGG